VYSILPSKIRLLGQAPRGHIVLEPLIGDHLPVAHPDISDLRHGASSSFQPDNAGGVALNITPLSAGVPEPATWAMALLGFAGFGLATRRARLRSSIPPAA
jgi:hypothetical protein